MTMFERVAAVVGVAATIIATVIAWYAFVDPADVKVTAEKIANRLDKEPALGDTDRFFVNNIVSFADRSVMVNLNKRDTRDEGTLVVSLCNAAGSEVMKKQLGFGKAAQDFYVEYAGAGKNLLVLMNISGGKQVFSRLEAWENGGQTSWSRSQAPKVNVSAQMSCSKV